MAPDVRRPSDCDAGCWSGPASVAAPAALESFCHTRRAVTEEQNGIEGLGVAEAKRRFGELIDRVQKGERFLVLRRGRPAVALVPPTGELRRRPSPPPRGLAAGAGALGDWEELPEVVAEIYAERRRARDRPEPDLG